jgi:hypothetical protein
MPVPFWINQSGLPHIANGSDFIAVAAAFQTWQNVPLANISFQNMGTTPVPTVGQDGQNVVTFVDDSVPLGSDTIASTFSFFTTDANGNLIIQEADIALNPAFDFSTSGDPDKYDIQGILTHEIGHFLGLDHSAMLSSVMTPFGTTAQLDQRTLSYDDMAGVALLYPNPSSIAANGAISGRITAGPTPVFGAHVVAVDTSGTAIASAMSQPDGTYQIAFLPPGAYRLYADPMDGPITEDAMGGTPDSFYFQLNTSFSTTYLGGVADLNHAATIQVFAGTNTGGANIGVLVPSSLNLTEPATYALHIPVGSQGTLTVGGSSLTPGDSFSISGAGITLGTPVYAGNIASDAPTSAHIPITIDATAAVGPKNLSVTRNGASSVLTGGVVLVHPVPSNIRVAPTTGLAAGGTEVSITGGNFRDGALVYFGGLPASNVQVVNGATIQATSPPNVNGVSNIVVVNSDGTWGVQTGGFTYSGLAPQITSIAPAMGAPAAVVSILGTGFSPRISDVQVSFNGAPATVSKSTSTRIDVVVPYNATTGAVTVSVDGQTAAGPVFTVVPPPITSNLATANAQFIDATFASGGTTLSFEDLDDSATLASLPFTFTLFDKSYVEGSKVAIATNGWMSLDAVTNPEFQNGPLPGATSQRPDGSMGSIAPALIAPFFDDLFLTASSNVSVRTVGVAPNRQFVIEWANVGIFDESGNDTSANLAFEAILFEGSNDIEFVYGSMSGPRSDGSSATIGIQNSTRTKAVQTGFNQSIVSSGVSIPYHFIDGAYGPPAPPPLTNLPYSITNLGGVSAITAGAGSIVKTGYATLQPSDGSTTPSGFSIFGYRVNGTLVTEASVPAAPLQRAGRIYAEVSGPVNTGLAIANPNNVVATVSFYFTDGTGNDFGSGTAIIPANSHLARFLNEAPFNGGSNVHGAFSFSSDQPISVVALRGFINERNDFLVSTLPVADTSVTNAAGTPALPHFADGGGWRTQVVLVNPTDSAISGSVLFLDPNGQTLNTFPFTIPKHGSFNYATAGAGASTKTGSVQIVPDDGDATPTSFAIFSYKAGGITISEASVQSSTGTAFRTYVEASGALGSINSVESGVAVTNTGSTAATITLDLTDLSGKMLASTSLTLPAHGQIAKFLNEVFPSVPLPVQGIFRLTTSGSGLAVAGLRGRYNERGDFLITTTPPSNENAPTSTIPTFFSHIVDGGGYTTQFLLFSGIANQSADGNLVLSYVN